MVTYSLWPGTGLHWWWWPLVVAKTDPSLSSGAELRGDDSIHPVSTEDTKGWV